MEIIEHAGHLTNWKIRKHSIRGWPVSWCNYRLGIRKDCLVLLWKSPHTVIANDFYFGILALPN